MKSAETYAGGENFDLRTMLVRGNHLRLNEKVGMFGSLLDEMREKRQLLTMRCIQSASDTEVDVLDPVTGSPRRMLMFGSNNYLGFANDPYVREVAIRALNRFGTGIGGPPLLNGTTTLHRDLELRLAALKGTEDALIFSSGYGANVGIITALAGKRDMVVYDAYSHASFCDGITMSGVESYRFPHNDTDRLVHLLDIHPPDSTRDLFVGVEGVYSMDGDLAPLDVVVPLCRKKGAILIVDDAHGTGTTGRTGRGTAEHFGVEGDIDVTMGTFSKTFAVSGGFVASSRAVVDYLRYFARPHMFSAALPPVVIASVHAGLDLLEREPERLTSLRQNVRRAVSGLKELGIDVATQSAIIPLRVPVTMDMRRAALRLHELGIFVNAVEFPAVPVAQQRFRVSLMATHTPEQIERLVEGVGRVWNEWRCGELLRPPARDASGEMQ
jgi:glycine C-acetyltransferase